MAHTVFLFLLLVVTVVTSWAFELTLSRASLEEAILIGQTRLESVGARFNLPYRIPVNRSPIDYIEIVTPFRRVALAAETRARLGERMFGQREALAMLGDLPERVDLLVELTFHPQNTYIGVPPYEVRLVPSEPERAGPAAGSGTPIEPLNLARVPRNGPRLQGTTLPYPYPTGPQVPAGSQPLLGGTLIAQFDGRRLSPDGTYVALITENGKEVARVRIGFGPLR